MNTFEAPDSANSLTKLLPLSAALHNSGSMGTQPRKGTYTRILNHKYKLSIS